MAPFNKKSKAPIREEKEYDEEVIQIDRVTRVVKGGRRLRFRATVVIGNHKGKVGVGIGKSTEVQGAIKKGIAQAKKALVTVPMVGQTIPHRVDMKFKSARMIIMPARPGTGIIAGGPLRKVIELAGIKDVLSKCLGSKNRLNNSQAAAMALATLKQLPWVKKIVPATAVKPVLQVPEAASKEGAPKTAPSKKENVAKAPAPKAPAAPVKAEPKKESTK